MKPTQMVFDIGGVLVDRQPALAFEEAAGGHEAAEAFMARVGFKALKTRADDGETFADLAQEIADKADRALFETYVEGTWTLLGRMKSESVPIHAITNWSAETWPRGLVSQPLLGEVFDTLVVSGREGMMKPKAEIFALFCARAGVEPQDCFFVDDGIHNVEGALAAGMDAEQFVTPGKLEQDLIARGLL